MNKIKLAALLASSTVFALGLNCLPNVGGQLVASLGLNNLLAGLGITTGG